MIYWYNCTRIVIFRRFVPHSLTNAYTPVRILVKQLRSQRYTTRQSERFLTFSDYGQNCLKNTTGRMRYKIKKPITLDILFTKRIFGNTRKRGRLKYKFSLKQRNHNVLRVAESAFERALTNSLYVFLRII